VTDILGSGISFPLGVDRRGNLALARGERDVEEAIGIVLGTAPGERPMRPEFGCAAHDYVFETVDAYTLGRIEYEVLVALDRWEPRIEVLDLEFNLDRVAQGELLIDITYRLRATNDVRNLVYPFYVIPAEETV
jgi:phage baseplate assembly protein W